MSQIQNFNYDSLLERIITHYEELAESNGQDGAHELYEQQMETATKLREGLKSFKENYTIPNQGHMTFLPEFFRIMKAEYGCDIDELLRWAIPAYTKAKVTEKEQLEKELSNLAVFKTALEEGTV